MADATARDRHTTRVLVAACVALFASFAVPLVAVAIPLIASFSSGGPIRVADARGAAAWHGAMYYVALSPRRDSPLWKSELGTDRAVDVAKSGARYPWLVPTDHALWLFGRDRVESYDGAHVDVMSTSASYLVHRPFVYDDEPAMLEVEPRRLVLYVWRGGSFVEAGAMSCRCSGVSRLDARAVASGGELDLFLSYASEVRHRHAKLGADVGDPSSWTLLASGVQRMEVARLGAGRFVLALGRSRTRRATDVELVVGDALGVKSLATQPLDVYTSGFGLSTDESSDHILLAAPGNLNGDLSLYEYSTAGFVREGHPSGGMGLLALVLWPNLASLAVGLVFGLGLASLLSKWTRELRGDELVIADRRFELASLTQRAWAQIVDSSLQALPFLLLLVLLATGTLPWQRAFTPPRGPLYIFGFALLAIVWGVAWLGAMGLAEWKTGKTPGKWLVGIKVESADGEPLGLGRALARNFLEYADAMFHFTVGMAIVALTEKRQRLGDIAARSIVVRDVRPRRD